MFKTLPTADFSAFGAPIQKLIELNTATFTKAFELQKAAIEKQVALAQADFKAFSSIKDVEAFTAFVTAKSEEAKAQIEEMQAEAKIAAESSKAYFDEVQAILTSAKDTVAKPAAKAPAKKEAA
ncbi:phasin family protein [Amphritea opalescens]|uniref:Phasin family protein n=1 Tax=Amphritea opalescens TaxID=2490544 RepID=A0A430KRB3_9GAMM|nr:phasin family protein [Amphritea opalescens]RTE66022.1 phasin family protein [Amphritea opalescens]